MKSPLFMPQTLQKQTEKIKGLIFSLVEFDATTTRIS